MASHDILRKSHGPRSDDELKKDLQKIDAYRKTDEQIAEAIRCDNLSLDTLKLTSKLLKGTSEHDGNPEYYTIWSHRRRILLRLFADGEQATLSHMSQELEFQLPLLKRYPKCYWLWNHRIWILTQASKRLKNVDAQNLWRSELTLDTMMLTRDNRNFHGWNYRRRIVKELLDLSSPADEFPETAQEEGHISPVLVPNNDDLMNRLLEDEFAYTRKMASSSLSNFSAWHQRARLIPRILDLRRASEIDRRALYDDELAYIREAVLIDPWNQSLWFFHDYMMTVLLNGASDHSRTIHAGSDPQAQWVEFTNHDRKKILANEIEEIKEVLDDTDDCKWIYQSLLNLARAYLEVDAGSQGHVFTMHDLREWLGRLKTIDPLRHARWNDMSAQLGLS